MLRFCGQNFWAFHREITKYPYLHKRKPSASVIQWFLFLSSIPIQNLGYSNNQIFYASLIKGGCLFWCVLIVNVIVITKRVFYMRFHFGRNEFCSVRCLVNLFTSNTPGVVACTCNPATLEAEFRNGAGSVPVGGNSSFIGGWIVFLPVIQYKEKSLTKYWT